MEIVSWQFCLSLSFGEKIWGKENNFLPLKKNQTLILSLKLGWCGKQKEFLKQICDPCCESTDAIMQSSKAQILRPEPLGFDSQLWHFSLCSLEVLGCSRLLGKCDQTWGTGAQFPLLKNELLGEVNELMYLKCPKQCQARVRTT